MQILFILKNSLCRGINKVKDLSDMLQVPLEDTQHKFKIFGMKSDSDVWPKICRLARGTCTLPVLMNN